MFCKWCNWVSVHQINDDAQIWERYRKGIRVILVGAFKFWIKKDNLARDREKK